jgi:hypothetical protein
MRLAGVAAVMQGTATKAMRDGAITERMIQLGMVMREKGTAHYQQFMRTTSRATPRSCRSSDCR